MFKVPERVLLDPDPGTVRIRVEACGVCHSDAGLLHKPRQTGHPLSTQADPQRAEG